MLTRLLLAAGAVALLVALGGYGIDRDDALAPRSGAVPRGTTQARVVRVVDGDTVVLTRIGTVRLIGIDTPEVYGGVECYGEAASAFAKRVLQPGRAVRYRLGADTRDRYGRVLAYVWLADGTFFNELLARRGYATPLTIPPNDDYAARFAAAARAARDADRGLWAECGGA